MKSKYDQKQCTNIREFGLIFKPDEDRKDNYIWRAQDKSKNNYTLYYIDDLWRCELQSSIFSEGISSFKHLNAKDAIHDCLDQAFNEANDVANEFLSMLNYKK